MRLKTLPLLEIDLSGATEKEEVHERLSAAFGSPCYYGKNWDAFWDCVTTLALTPDKIKIRGIEALTETLPREAELLRKCLTDFQSTPQGLGVEVVFQ